MKMIDRLEKSLVSLPYLCDELDKNQDLQDAIRRYKEIKTADKKSS